MSTTTRGLHINYVELPAIDLSTTKRFYSEAFGWSFTDYGDAYVAFTDSGLEGGFTTRMPVRAGGPLVILYAIDLEQAQTRVEAAGGRITSGPYDFPGGRRFHFADPNGNELAIWSEK